MEYILIAVRCMAVVVFSVSLLSKVVGAGAHAQFLQTIRALRVGPAKAAAWIGGGVILTEALIVLLLLLPGGSGPGLMLAALLLAAFTGALVRAIRRGVSTSCRCFGRLSSAPLTGRQVARNGAIGALVVLGLLALAAPGSSPLDPLGVATALASGLVLAIVIVAFDDLADLALG